MQLYEREVVIVLNIVLNFKSKHFIKGAMVNQNMLLKVQWRRLKGNQVNLNVAQILQKTPISKNKNQSKPKEQCRNPPEKLKHLKMKNKNFYNLFRSLTWQIQPLEYDLIVKYLGATCSLGNGLELQIIIIIIIIIITFILYKEIGFSKPHLQY